MEKCKICNREFKNKIGLVNHINFSHDLSSEEYYINYLNGKHKCPVCGNDTKFLSISLGYSKHCSSNCSNNSKKTKDKKKQTCLKHYGVDNPNKSKEVRRKTKHTCLDKYGFDHPMKFSKFIEKSKKTCFRNFGVEHPLQNEYIRKQAEETCLKNNGVPHSMQSEAVREKYKRTLIKKLGVDNPSKSKKIIFLKRKKFYKYLLNSDRLKEKCIPLFKLEKFNGIGTENKYPFKCTSCNTEFEDHLDNGRIPRCPVCYPQYRSLFEQEVSSFCKQFFPNLIENDRSVLEGHELDIYIPFINLAIECNGLYWHSEINGKDKDYHLDKTIKCKEKGIKLIHIFDNEWNENKNRIKKILLKEMNIIPRETNFKDKMIVNRRFSDGDYLVENGYGLVKTIEPEPYYIFKKENLNKVWDCGKLIYKTYI